MNTDTYQIENELMTQKDMILSAVNNENYDAALTMLEVCLPVWKATDYTYKATELAARMVDVLRYRIMDLPIQATRQRREAQETLERIRTLGLNV